LTPQSPVDYSDEMNNLNEELVIAAREISEIAPLPKVARIELPNSSSSSQSKYSKFGLLALEDDSAGFFYRLLDEAQWIDLHNRGTLDAQLRSCIGKNPVDLVQDLHQHDQFSRGLAMAAINAISQHVFRAIAFPMKTPKRFQSSQQRDEEESASRVGMVGYFNPLVTALQNKAIPTTVIELDESLFTETEPLLVTGNRGALKECKTIYCSASTLLNHSLETILNELKHDPWIELIGPTCGCFPDPFFKRGVNRLGSSRVRDTNSVITKINQLLPWGESVEKYEIDACGYCGFEQIKQQLKRVINRHHR